MIQHHQESIHLERKIPYKRVLTYHTSPLFVFLYSIYRYMNNCWDHRREWLSYPVLFGMCIPLVCFDIFLEVYHRTTFSLLMIPYIRRSRYIRIDRHRLPYLSWSQKIACAYCGYANGLLQYAIQIAGQTEAFFCPIKHQCIRSEFSPPPHHQQFAEYGDLQGYRKKISEFRFIEKPTIKSFNPVCEIPVSHTKQKLKKPTSHSPSAT